MGKIKEFFKEVFSLTNLFFVIIIILSSIRGLIYNKPFLNEKLILGMYLFTILFMTIYTFIFNKESFNKRERIIRSISFFIATFILYIGYRYFFDYREFEFSKILIYFLDYLIFYLSLCLLNKVLNKLLDSINNRRFKNTKNE